MRVVAPPSSTPTTEYDGLRELAEVHDHGEALQVLLRLARAIRAEDDRRVRASAIETLDSTIVRLETWRCSCPTSSDDACWCG